MQMEDKSIDLKDEDEPDLDISLSPFQRTIEITTSFSKKSLNPLGFKIASCAHQKCAFAYALSCAPERYSLQSTKKHFTGGYILKIGEFQ